MTYLLNSASFHSESSVALSALKRLKGDRGCSAQTAGEKALVNRNKSDIRSILTCLQQNAVCLPSQNGNLAAVYLKITIPDRQ